MPKINDIRTSLLAALILSGAFSVSARAATPSAPTGLTAKATIDSQVSLSWTAPSGAPTSYNIYRSTSSGGETLLQSGDTITTFEDSNLNYGQTYYYKVTAVNGSGEGAKSPEASALTKAAPPNSLAASAGDSQIALTWSASPTATGYRIYRDTLGGPGGATSFIVTGTSCTDTGLVNGTTYYYQIDAINGSGETPTGSPQAMATPVSSGGTVAPTGPPTNLTAVAGNAEVILNWSPVSNATSYQIFRGGSQVGTSNATTFTFTDKLLSNGTSYSYLVKAVNTTGQTSSSAVAATPNIPSAPVVTATGGIGQVVLTWPAVSGTSYAVYRGVAPGSENLLDQGLTGNTYTDAGLSKGGMYYYRVALSNPGATGPLSSEVSAIATATNPSSWSGNISYNASGEPVQVCFAYIPDVNRPIQGVYVDAPATAGMLSNATFVGVAAKYNLMMLNPSDFNFGSAANPLLIPTVGDGHNIQVLDWRCPLLSGQRLLALLNAAAAQFPAHAAEIQNANLILHGFSESVDNVNMAISPAYSTQTGGVAPSPFANRVLAILQLSEFDEASVHPVIEVDAVPHLFLASGVGDPNSTLNLYQEDFSFPSVTFDTLVRGLATNQGAPLTVVNDAGMGHTGTDLFHPFVSLWLDSLLSQRLPATTPTSPTGSLPSWQSSLAWVGTYNVSSPITSAPWGSSANPGVQMTSNLVTSRTTYSDPRPFTWLPSQNVANDWLAYANSGTSASLGPVITSATTATASAGGAFGYQITASGLPTSFSATGLPSSLTLDSTTGIITNTSGTTLSAGNYSVTIGATNAQGSSSINLAITLTGGVVNPVLFTIWAGLKGISLDPSVSAQSDGVSDLMKYFCDIDPTIPLTAVTRAALPTIFEDTTTQPGKDYLTLVYQQSKSAINVTPVLQTSPNMQTWTPVTSPAIKTSKSAPNGDTIWEVGVDITNSSNPPFLRLQLQTSQL